MSVRVNRLPHNELREQLARSGQNAESFAADLAAQPELLAAAAELLKKRNGEVASIQSDLEAPATSAKKKRKKASKAVLDELFGGVSDLSMSCDVGYNTLLLARLLCSPTAHQSRSRDLLARSEKLLAL